MRLNKPAVGIVPDADGVGYRFVASDGGVFTFDAEFRGSLGDITLIQAVNGMINYGNGYLMVARDGGIFASDSHGRRLSDQDFHGSLGDVPLSSPIVGIAAIPI